jgi:enterochelin esterase-like enzyme/sugar lactone lactonase YvrE
MKEFMPRRTPILARHATTTSGHFPIPQIGEVLVVAIIVIPMILVQLCVAQTTTPSVPSGETHKYSFTSTKIFPGTVRDYWIYIPAQYNPAKPACLIVDQDNIQFKSPAVFDRLIATGQMPITIAVYVAPGKVKAPTTQALDRFNRSYEFDGLSDDYVRFLLEELLPDAEKKTAADGRAIHFSRNPNDRAIMGSSSGAIAAFTAAWNRPDSFSRIFSAIGTFVDLRGGNIYPSLIRKFEPKPIRIFLQDGSADHNHYGGDWWMANQEMERALTFAGYEVNHVWGTGDHDSKQATEIFADVMTWLWKDWPAPIKTGLGSEQLQQILIPGETWKPIDFKFVSPGPMTMTPSGDILLSDWQKLYVIAPDLTVSEFPATAANRVAAAFGPGNRLYQLSSGNLTVDDPAGYSSALVRDLHGTRLVVAFNGNIYVVDPAGPGNVCLIDPNGKKQIADSETKLYDGITLSPDQTLLYAADERSHWVYSYQIQPDGSLAHKQKFYDLYVPDSEDDAGASAMCTDRDGRLYVATNAGIQVCDQAGRVVAIIPVPSGAAAACPVTDIAFAGENFDRLYAVAGNKVYVRKLKTRGTLPFDPPIKPAPPKL